MSQMGSSTLSLVLVALMIPLALWWLKRAQAARFPHASQLKIAAVLQVGSRERIAVVEIQGKWILVGITAHTIQTLSVLEKPQGDPVPPAGHTPHTPRTPFAALLENWKNARR